MAVQAGVTAGRTCASQLRNSFSTRALATCVGPSEISRQARYWEIFEQSSDSVRDAFPGADLGGQCPFAFSMQQPMRNLAIALGLEQFGNSGVRRAWLGLCAPDDNTDAAGHWEDWRNRLPHDPFAAPGLPASEVVRAGEADGLGEWSAYMRERCLLQLPLPPI